MYLFYFNRNKFKMNNVSKLTKTLHLSKLSFCILLILIILSFSTTFYLLLPNNELVKNPINLQYILLADVILVLVLLSIIIRQVLLILIYRKKNYDESRLYIKFINLFTGMALGPAIGVFIITSLFYNLELRTWYGGAVKEVVINSITFRRVPLAFYPPAKNPLVGDKLSAFHVAAY